MFLEKFKAKIMNKIIIILFVLIGMAACHDTEVGYLEAEDAIYVPDSLVVRNTPDPVLDAIRIENDAPWLSNTIQGIIGTQPMSFHIVDVKGASEQDKSLIIEKVRVDGGGRFWIPLDANLPVGEHIISLEVRNEGQTRVLKDIFRLIIED
jgi:hypothetical protein